MPVNQISYLNCFSLKKWIIMDGEINPSWVDNISCLLDDHKRAHLSNLDDITLPTSTSVIFEVANFSTASPAVATRYNDDYNYCTDVVYDLNHHIKAFETIFTSGVLSYIALCLTTGEM